MSPYEVKGEVEAFHRRIVPSPAPRGRGGSFGKVVQSFTQERSKALALPVCRHVGVVEQLPMRFQHLRVPLAALAIASAGAAALDVSGSVPARRGNFDRLLSLDRSVRMELRQSNPDAAAVRRTALAEEQLARQLPSWFPAGTGPGDNVRTNARPEIWTNNQDFRAKANRLAVALDGLARAASSGDAGRMRDQQASVGEACQTCHRSYLNRF